MPITHIQTLQHSPAGGGTQAQVTMTVTAGNAVLIAAMEYYPEAVTLSSIPSNTFTLRVGPFTNTTNAILRLYECLSVAGGSTVFTASTSALNYPTLFVSEFNGLATSAAFDQQADDAQVGVDVNSSSTVTTAQPNELLFGLMAADTSTTTGITAPGGSGFTIAASQSASGAGVISAVEYQIVSATGTYSAQFTLDASRVWAAAIATYLGASAAGALSASASESLLVSDTRRQLG